MGALTLGIGFAAGTVPALIAGAAAYALGWVYLPDAGFFKRWLDSKVQRHESALADAQLAAFREKQSSLLARLTPERSRRYDMLAAVCEEIEHSRSQEHSQEAGSISEPQLRRLDDLMWTYLKMLAIEQSLSDFLEGEHREDLPRLLERTDTELEELKRELSQPMSETVRESRKRLEQSLTDRLIVLQKRVEKCNQAVANLDLVRSEQSRLEDQIKLVRAEAVASRNTANLSTRINATVEQLDHTNRWMSEMEEFKDLVGEVPSTAARVGYHPDRQTGQGTSATRQPPVNRPLASGNRG